MIEDEKDELIRRLACEVDELAHELPDYAPYPQRTRDLLEEVRRHRLLHNLPSIETFAS